ncbi:hypothetical protein C4D60_Mb11t15900 [Musa balbisiana]|uniref:Kinesin motor domain-containing protein n=1 Tax=Musa balbisiana TaxID=52838 RepID=A0A4S8J4D8_MUSBA|nr:hypothetical protein C4D60_Mb11t15900 [Musa balbisiana]
MASDSLSVVAEDVLKPHETRTGDIDLASRKEVQAALRRYEAAEWLRKMVGVNGARDLPEEPTEEEFRLGLRNGIVLCNALNKVQPGAVPKVVEAPADSALLPDGAALSAYQYFENLRNFLVSMEELGLPTFEASDLEGDGVSVEQNVGVNFSIQSTEMTTSQSLNMLLHAILSDKKPEEVPVIVESMLSRVMQEFERRIASQNDQTAKTENSFPSTKDEDSSMSLNDAETSKGKLLKQHLLFDRQKREIQELKGALQTTRAGMELMRTQHAQEFSNLGKHMQVLAQAASGYHKVLEENRKLYNQVQDLKGNIRVYCRVRPFLPRQSSSMSTVGHIDDGNIMIITPSKYGKGHKSFSFNKVFGPFATQEEVFSDTQPLIRSVLDGYNVCIFAYGQTGAGKTYTMSGPKELTEESFGVNYRALNDLFHISNQRKETFCYEIAVQMIEIYNEQVRDLLTNDGPQKRYPFVKILLLLFFIPLLVNTLDIHNSSQKGLAVPNANLVPVTSTTEVIELMNIGQKNRAVSATAMNDRSSRSHSCLTIHVQGRDLASGAVLRGCMHLVDLAGSERVNKSEAKGDRLKEAQHINKSLSALGDVISALAQKSSHIPYRNSKLTQLLQDSLGGQAKTLMFVHISPEADAISETLSTLKFAERVASVELGAAQVNKESGEVKELRQQVASLKAALAKKEGEQIQSTMSSPDIYRLKSGATSPAHPNQMQMMEDFGNIEVLSCSAMMQERVEIDLQDLLRASDSSLWPEDSLRGWEGDNLHMPDSFYQGYVPDVMRVYRDHHRSWANSIATDDSDDLDFATSDSSEQDMLSQYNLPKSNSNAVNGGSKIKRPQSGPVKSSETRTPSRTQMPSPSSKLSNTPGQTVNRSNRQLLSGSADGKRRPIGKAASGK